MDNSLLCINVNLKGKIYRRILLISGILNYNQLYLNFEQIIVLQFLYSIYMKFYSMIIEYLVDVENVYILFFRIKISRGIKNKICYVKFKILIGDEKMIYYLNLIQFEYRL